MKRLTGQKLAKAYAILFDYLGDVHGSYDGGGWITVCGYGLRPHPDLSAQYPNGWSMLHRVRCGRARRELQEAVQ